MEQAEKILRRWRQQRPRDGVDERDAIRVMEHLGMDIRVGGEGHVIGFHKKLVGSAQFPMGTITVNSHAFGRQGTVHPKAIHDIVKAAIILEGEE